MKPEVRFIKLRLGIFQLYSILPPNMKNTPFQPKCCKRKDDAIGSAATPTPDPLIAIPVARALFFSK